MVGVEFLTIKDEEEGKKKRRRRRKTKRRRKGVIKRTGYSPYV